MATFKDATILTNYVKSQLISVLNKEVNEMGKDEYRKSEKDKIYGRKEGYSYNRTYEFLNSVDSSITLGSTLFRLTLFNNSDSTDSHFSYLGIKQNNNNLANWLNSGQNGITPYEGTFYLDNAEENIRKLYSRTVILALKKRGINATSI